MENERKIDLSSIKNIPLNFGNSFYSEDTRLSKIIKSVVKDADTSKKYALMSLKEYLYIPDNLTKVYSTTELNIPILQEIFNLRQCKPQFKQEVAECIGRILYIYLAYPDVKSQGKILDIIFPKNKTQETEVYYLNSIEHALQMDTRSEMFKGIISTIAQRCLKSLELAENSDLLESILQLSTTLSKLYPSAFKRIFRESMDILIGWLTDTGQKASTLTFIETFLLQLSSFWASDLAFTFNLCTQFIEDMSHYMGRLEEMGEDGRSRDCEDEVHMFTVLLNVLTIVINCLVKSSPVENQYLLEMFDKVLGLCEYFSTKLHNEDSLIIANKCIKSIIIKLGSMDLPYQNTALIDFMLNQVTVTSIDSQSYVLSLLSILTTYIETGSTKLSEVFVMRLLGASSILPRLCYLHHSEVMPALISTYLSIINLKSVPLLVGAYECILKQMETAMNILINSKHSRNYKYNLLSTTHTTATDATTTDATTTTDYTNDKAQTVLLFNICVLSELGNAKSNIIAMYALSPSIFTLLAERLKPLHPVLTTNFPTIHIAIIRALYSHCCRHQQFVWKSILIDSSTTSNTTDKPSLVTTTLTSSTSSSSTALHFQNILHIVYRLLNNPCISKSCRCLALKWCIEITNQLSTIKHTTILNLFTCLILAVIDNGYSSESEVSLLSCCCLGIIVDTFSYLHPTVLNRYKRLVCIKLTDTDADIKAAFSNLLTHLPTFIINVDEDQHDDDDGVNPMMMKNDMIGDEVGVFHHNFHKNTYSKVHKQIMTSSGSENFGNINFATIANFILSQAHLNQDEMPSDWLERQYFMCQSNQSNSSSISKATSQLISNNSDLQWFWAVWQCAQFCVDSKLKTSIGLKPQDTFFSIEETIKGFLVRLSNDTSSLRAIRTVSREITKTSLRQSWLLLQWMEQLEKNLYNAYEGSSCSLPQPSKVVRTFFKTNKATCMDWMGRTRLSLVSIATPLLPTKASFIVRLSYALLADIKETKYPTTNLQRILVNLCRALFHLKAHQCIEGLMVWCRDTWPCEDFAWMEGVDDAAQGRLEDGIKTVANNYNNIRRGSEQATSVTRFLEEQVTNAYISLTCYKEALKWRENVNGYNINGGDNGGGECEGGFGVMESRDSGRNGDSFDHVDSHVDYIKKMMKFDDLKTLPVLPLRERNHDFDAENDDNEEKEEDDEVELRVACDWDYGEVMKGLECRYVDSLAPLFKENFKKKKKAFKAFYQANNVSNDDDDDYLDGDGDDDDDEKSGIVFRNSNDNSISRQILRSTYAQVNLYMRMCDDLLSTTTNQKTAFINNQSQLFNFMASSLLQLLSQSSFYHAGQIQTPKPSQPWFLSSALAHSSSPHLKALERVDIQDQLKLLNHYQLLNHIDPQSNHGTHVERVRLSAIKNSRRHGNFQLCQRLIIDQANMLIKLNNKNTREDENNKGSGYLFSGQNNVSIVSGDDNDGFFVRKLEMLSQLDVKDDVSSLCTKLHLELQAGKLLREQGEMKEACDVISRALYPGPSHNKSGMDVVKGIQAKMLLRLVGWLQSENKQTKLPLKQKPSLSNSPTPIQTFHPSSSASLMKKLRSMLDKYQGHSASSFHCPGLQNDEGLSEVDRLTKDLLTLSTIHAPLLAKAWYQLANWSYKWGRKAVDGASDENFNLSANEDFSLVHNMPPGYQIDQLEKVRAVVAKVHIYGGQSEEDDILGSLQRRCDNEEDSVRLQLLIACPPLHHHADKVDALVRLWKSVIKRVYKDYNMAATAYFSYLKISNEDSKTSSTTVDGDSSTTATLRLLRLLVKHSWGLKEVLQQGLAHSLTSPWKGIIPQLFSRLNHPEPYVRRSITDLLCRIAFEDAEVIIYPSIVAHSSVQKTVVEHKGKDSNKNEEDEDEDDEDEEEEDEGIKSSVSNCFSDILNTLTNTNPRMVKEIQLLVTELHRITLLWDELWLGALSHVHNDVLGKVRQMGVELKDLTANEELDESEKEALALQIHQANMHSTIYLLEKLQQITSQAPATNHERSFQQRLQPLIDVSVAAIKQPQNLFMPELTWNVFKKLLHQLQHHSHRHKGAQTLVMQRISPLLNKLKSTLITLPASSSSSSSSIWGSLYSSKRCITLESISSTVQILPTKTRPKKLVLVGSDGVRYPYLFKGLEDLHLDERIMQFLSVVNNMLANNKGSDGKFQARRYSVTPLGAKSGLIGWVDGATSVFSLYKRWCAREAQYNHSKQTGNEGSSVVVARPSEQFHNKLVPLLNEKGISMEKRKDWPIGVLRRVVDELVQETPADLLAKEMWCQSTTACDWWRINQSYARSTAVMSMVGYIIGLGDRHLDNLLIDLSSGEIVHIDYNVCFEKGKSLKVPENVPFRMTQNIQHALGLTGVEGTFRLSCETVLRTLRKGKETLLTLLEAFVYDPLVDWTAANEGGHTSAFYGGNHAVTKAMDSNKTRKVLERRSAESKFNITMSQMKGVWSKNRSKLLSCTENLRYKIQLLHTDFQAVEKLQENIKQHQEQCTYLNDALEDHNHPITTLKQRYLENCEIDKVNSDLLTQLTRKRAYIRSVLKSHQESFDWLDVLDQSEEGTTHHLTNPMSDAIIKFLSDAGKTDLIDKFQHHFDLLSSSADECQQNLIFLTKLLLNYHHLLKQNPQATSLSNLVLDFYNWSTHLTADFSQHGLNRVREMQMERARVKGMEMEAFVATITKWQQQLNQLAVSPGCLWLDSTSSEPSLTGSRPALLNEMDAIQHNMADAKLLLEVMASEGSVGGIQGAFKSHFDPVLFPPLSRDVVMQVPRRLANRQHLADLLESMVLVHEEGVVKQASQLQEVVMAISQRLNWAGNSNKAVSVALEQFSLLSTENHRILKIVSERYRARLKEACSLHNYELITSDAVTRNALLSDFNKLLEGISKFFFYPDRNRNEIDAVEKGLLENEIVRSTENMNVSWMKEHTDKIISHTQQLLTQLPPLQDAIIVHKDEVSKEVENVRSCLLQHNKLVTELRIVFKELNKFEESSVLEKSSVEKEDGKRKTEGRNDGEKREKKEEQGGEIGSMGEFVEHYKHFSIFFSAFLHTCFCTDSINASVCLRLSTDFPHLLNLINRTYEYPVRLAEEIMTHKKQDDKDVKDNILTTPDINNDGNGKKLMDPKTGKAIQQRNCVAVSMWRRVKAKLDGRDGKICGSEDRRLPVSEQVNLLIKEATNIDNLALLYEGWTAWV